MRSVAEVHFFWFRIKTRQLVFDGLQRLDHLPGEEQFGPLLRLDHRQHFAAPVCRYARKPLAGFVGSLALSPSPVGLEPELKWLLSSSNWRPEFAEPAAKGVTGAAGAPYRSIIPAKG